MKNKIVRVSNPNRSLVVSEKVFMVLLIAGAFLLALPPRSSGQKTDRTIKIVVVKPVVKGGGLTPTAFSDRLIAALKKEPVFEIGYIENAVDRGRAKQDAAAQKYDFILFTAISSAEDKSPGSVIGKLGRKDLRFKVHVEYVLEAVGDSNTLLNDKLDSNERKVEESVGKIVEKIAKDVTEKAKQTIASRPVSTVAPVTTEPAPQLAPTTVTTIRSSSPTATSPRLVVQTAHSTMVTDFAYSPDGRLCATLGSDGIVKLWNTESRIEINTFSGYRTVGIAFSPDGKTVAALGKDGIIRLFDVVSGQLTRRLTEINRSKPNREKDSGDLFNLPVSIAFGPEGRFLVSGSENGVKVFEVESGKHLRTLLKDKEVPLVAISPDGIHIAAVVDENEVKVFSTATGKEIKGFHSKVGKVTAIVFSQNSQSLILGSRYGTIRIFDFAKGNEIGEPPLFQPCDKPYEAFGVIKAGILRKGPLKDTIRLVGDTCEIGKDIGDLIKGRYSIYYETSIRSLALHPNGKLLAWSLGDNLVRVTNLQDKKEIYNIEPEFKSQVSGSLQQTVVSSIAPGGPRPASGQSPSTRDTTKAAGGDQKAQLVIAEFFQQLAPVRFSTDGKTLNGIREFKTVGRWDAATGKQVSSLAVAKRDLSAGFPFPVPWGSVPVFGSTGEMLVTGSLSKGTKLWDLKYGTTPVQIANSGAVGNKLPLSPNSELLVQVVPDGKDMKKITVREVLSEREVKSISVKCVAVEPEFTPDNKYIALRTYERGRFLTEASWLRIYELSTGQEVFKKKYVSHFDFSNDGKLLVMRLDKDEKSELLRIPFTSRKDDIVVVRVGGTEWAEVFKQRAEDSESGSFSSRVVFNSDASLIASLDFTVIKVWDIATGKVIAQRPLDANLDLSNLIFQPNKKVLTYTTYRSLNHWDITTDKVKTSSLLTDFWGNLDYSADGKMMALGGAENRVRLFDVENEKEIGSLIVPSQDDWIVMTPEGRLDTSRLEEVEEVHWILPGEPFSSQPLELFMRDFYEPRLMARLAAGDSFPEITDLSKRNRTLPEVTITNIAPESADSVRVTVQVKNTFSKNQFDANNRQYQSEAHNLRLFRDGQLVGYIDGSVLASGANEASRAFVVKLPHIEGKKQFEFSAYAFNNDRVKCITTKRVYEPATPPAPMKGKVYLISMGVNASENPKFNLRFAANDALETQKSLSATLRGSGRYSAVIEIPLISDYKTVNGKTALENNATKAAFRAVIDRLAGRSAQIPPGIPNVARIERVTPDDMVLISFAGHGYADKDGVFYMVPYDIGKDRPLADALGNCISSNELSAWLRDVDAADMIMIVDACYSAAAIEGNNFKPGPMGSRGLGQLAYDKGMQILAATQKDDVALELQRLQHGLLTFTLILEGIDGKAADHRPTDKKIMTTEWLRFAVRRVPKLYEDLRLGNPITTADGKKRDVKIVGNITPSTNPKVIDAQRPALFDFLWKRNEVVLANLQ